MSNLQKYCGLGSWRGEIQNSKLANSLSDIELDREFFIIGCQSNRKTVVRLRQQNSPSKLEGAPEGEGVCLCRKVILWSVVLCFIPLFSRKKWGKKRRND
ncbi:MAG: hypothetical protein IKL17_03955, partial [Alistipes sp.]|nr:hypothetical protein [Alistipes sp.]